MNILFFVENYIEGGSDKFLVELVYTLSLNKKNNFTLLLNKNAPSNFYYKVINLNNVYINRYNLITPNDIYNTYFQKKNIFFYFLYIISMYPLFFYSIIYFYFLNKRFYNNEIFVINNGGYPGGFYSRSYNLSLLLFNSNKKIFHIVHSIPDNYKIISYFIEKYLIDFFIKKKTIFISICKYIQDQLMITRNIECKNVIYNGVEDLQDLKITDNNNFTILHIASINENKNQEMLIDSIYYLFNNTSLKRNIIVKFVGTISDQLYYDKLVHKIKEYKLENHFFFIGSTNKIKYYLNTSDLLVLTSRIEGFPLVILEAFSASLPVISSNLGGIREQIQDNVNGFLFQVDNLIELSKCIEKIIIDKQLTKEIMINNRNRYLANFSLDKMIDNYKTIFNL